MNLLRPHPSNLRTGRLAAAAKSGGILQRALLLVALLAVGLISGCVPTPAADLKVDTAQQLQSRVLAVSQSAASKDYAGALHSLDLLNHDLASAAANGDISFARHQSIQNAIDLVRADLAAAMPTPTPTPEPTQTVFVPVPTTIVIPMPAPAPVPASTTPPPGTATADATTAEPTDATTAGPTSGDGNGGSKGDTGGHGKDK